MNAPELNPKTTSGAVAPAIQTIPATYPLSISTAEGGFKNAETIPLETDWDSFIDTVRVPMIGAKDGHHFIPLQFTDNYRNRDNAEGQAASLVILDGDGRIDTDTGECAEGAPDPLLLHEVLTDLDITHCIYSSHSNHTTDAKGIYKGDRYRVVMPCAWTGSDELAAMVGYLIDKLHGAGVMLNPVSENLDIARLWYTPRVPDQEHAELFRFYEHDGLQQFPVAEALAWWESCAHTRTNSKSRINAVQIAGGAGGSDLGDLHNQTRPIGKFNIEQGPNYIARTLVELGYLFKGIGGTSNGEATHRYLNPDSKSGEAGTVLFKGDDGVWRVFSHNDSDDLLEKHAHDAFSIYTLSYHKGDQRAALEGIGVNVKYTPEELQDYIDASEPTDRAAIGIVIKRLAGSSLSPIAEEDLVQQIKLKFKMNVGPIRAEIESVKRESAPAAPDEAPTGKDLMDACLKVYGADNVIFSEDSLWLWQERGVWGKYSKEYTTRILVHDIVTAKFPDWSFDSRHIADVYALIRNATAIPGEMQPKMNQHFINTLDCEVHWDVEAEAWETRQHSKTNLSTNQCQFNAGPPAECPRWDRFMLEILQHTGTPEDIREEIELLQACIGYTMTTSTKLERFVYLWGPGGNGKSKLMNLLSELLGRENKSAVQPDQFDNKFQLAHMDKKLANLVTEVQEGALMPAAKIKAIASGEACTVEHKNGKPFDTELFATQWFAANHLAPCRDHSDAFWDRAIVFKLPNGFRDTAAQDIDLDEKLAAEKDGIALKCLASYGAMLKERGRMVLPKVIQRNVAEWRHDTDPVIHFAEDCLVHDPDNALTHSHLYDVYRRWCDLNGVSRVKSRNLVTRLCRILNVEKGKGTGNVATINGLALAASPAILAGLGVPGSMPSENVDS